MGKETNKQQNTGPVSEINLPGTFIAVLLLGVLMLGSWFGIYALFLAR